MQKLVVGIDIAKDFFAVYEPTDNPKKPIQEELPYKTAEDIAAFVERYQGKVVHFIMEYTSCYYKRLAFALCQAGFQVSVVASKKAYYYSQALNNGTKTDKADAKSLQKMGASEELALYTAPTEESDQIKQKRSYLDKLRKRLQAVQGRLYNWEYEPYGAPIIKKMEEEQKEILEKNIKILEEELNALVKPEDKKHIEKLQTIPGVGKATAIAFVACVNSMPDFETHKNSKKIAKFAGLSPQVKQSGKQDKSRSTIRAGQGRLRTCLYQGAKAAIKRCKETNPFKTFFYKLQEKGKCYKKAMVATMHKMLRVCFSVLKTGKAYEAESICS